MQTRDEEEVVNQFLTKKALRAFDEQSAQSYRRSDEEYKVTVGDGGKFALSSPYVESSMVRSMSWT